MVMVMVTKRVTMKGGNDIMMTMMVRADNYGGGDICNDDDGEDYDKK